MKNYIVLDLEWNQSLTEKRGRLTIFLLKL